MLLKIQNFNNPLFRQIGFLFTTNVLTLERNLTNVRIAHRRSHKLLPKRHTKEHNIMSCEINIKLSENWLKYKDCTVINLVNSCYILSTGGAATVLGNVDIFLILIKQLERIAIEVGKILCTGNTRGVLSMSKNCHIIILLREFNCLWKC